MIPEILAEVGVSGPLGGAIELVLVFVFFGIAYEFAKAYMGKK